MVPRPEQGFCEGARPEPPGCHWEPQREVAHRHALTLGAEMATVFGNDTAARVYTAAAKEIEANIISVHWNAAKGIIMEVRLRVC